MDENARGADAVVRRHRRRVAAAMAAGALAAGLALVLVWLLPPLA